MVTDFSADPVQPNSFYGSFDDALLHDVIKIAMEPSRTICGHITMAIHDEAGNQNGGGINVLINSRSFAGVTVNGSTLPTSLAGAIQFFPSIPPWNTVDVIATPDSINNQIIISVKGLGGVKIDYRIEVELETALPKQI